jgi:hypothetical protein
MSCKPGFIYWIFDMDATDGILIFIVSDRTSVTKILNVSHNDNKAQATQVFSN